MDRGRLMTRINSAALHGSLLPAFELSIVIPSAARDRGAEIPRLRLWMTAEQSCLPANGYLLSATDFPLLPQSTYNELTDSP